MTMEPLKKWAQSNNFDQLINEVRIQLKKSDFITNIEKLMTVRGYSQFNQIDYPKLTVDSLLEICNFDDSEGYIKFAALYFIIDVIHLKFLYKDPKIEIIDEFCRILKFKDYEIQLVSAAWMLENGYPPTQIEKFLFNQQLPAYFRFYFMQQLLYANEFEISYKFYESYQFPLNDKYPEEGRSIVQCLTANGKLNKAHEFINQYCSPDGEMYKDFHKNYIIELYRVSKLLRKESDLNSIKFNEKEKEYILGYIACTEPANMIQFNAFYISQSSSS